MTIDEPYIAFFSSDARDLYKADIFRTLAQPTNSVIHFRYRKKYIDGSLVTNLEQLKGRSGAIFYTIGNDLSVDAEKRQLNHVSIRDVEICDLYESENTELVHFYLRLKNFCDLKIGEKAFSNFVTPISVQKDVKNKWVDRVNEVKGSFGNILFFSYEITDVENKTLDPSYSKARHDSIFKLNDESEYIIKFSFYDVTEGKSKLMINDDEFLKIHLRDTTTISTVQDDRHYKLVTRSIKQNKLPVQLSFLPHSNGKDYPIFDVFGFYEIIKKQSRVNLFGVFTSLAVLSITSFTALPKLYSKFPNEWSLILTALFALVLTGFSASKLYDYFNKT